MIVNRKEISTLKKIANRVAEADTKDAQKILKPIKFADHAGVKVRYTRSYWRSVNNLSPIDGNAVETFEKNTKDLPMGELFIRTSQNSKNHGKQYCLFSLEDPRFLKKEDNQQLLVSTSALRYANLANSSEENASLYKTLYDILKFKQNSKLSKKELNEAIAKMFQENPTFGKLLQIKFDGKVDLSKAGEKINFNPRKCHIDMNKETFNSLEEDLHINDLLGLQYKDRWFDTYSDMEKFENQSRFEKQVGDLFKETGSTNSEIQAGAEGGFLDRISRK